MSRIRILIADDHPIVRKGLLQLLEAEADMQVVEEAADGMEALEKIRIHHPDILLLDIAMPRLGGLETAQLVSSAAPETKIVILSMYENEVHVRQALDAGVLGYVLKGRASEEILTAIRFAYNGQYYFCSPIASSIVDAYLKGGQKEAPDGGYQSLSARERQVFLLLVEGLSTARIADTFCISPKTVEKHRLNIAKKLRTESTIEMAKYAIRTGLVDPEIWKS